MPSQFRLFVSILAVFLSASLVDSFFAAAITKQCPCTSRRSHPPCRIRLLSLVLAVSPDEEQFSMGDVQQTCEANVVNSIALDTNAAAEGDGMEQIIIESSDIVNRDEDAFVIVRVWNLLMEIKEKCYARIRKVFSDLFTVIQRSTQKTQAWIRDDAVGQLVSSALALIAFFAAVAAFAVWNIEVLGGKKFAAPTQVIIPNVQLPESSSVPKSVQFQKPKWQAPKITTSYSNSNADELES